MIIIGTSGDDIPLIGTPAADEIYGFGGRDELRGEGGEDLLYGGDDNDRLSGGTGLDRLNGELGDDSYSLQDLSLALVGGLGYDSVIELEGGGLDTVSVLPVSSPGSQFGVFSYTLPDNVEDGIILSVPNGDPGATPLPFDLTGNALANGLDGNRADNVLSGLEGDDQLYGNRGRDRLVGGAGNDTYLMDDTAASFVGGFFFFFPDDVVEETDGGTDLVRIFNDQIDLIRAYALPDNVESGWIEGEEAFDLEGNALGNLLRGGGGANRLTGLGGVDIIIGLGGADVGDGGDGGDSLRGGDGDDLLFGGEGHDYFNGDGGDDRFDGGSGQDRVSFFRSATGVTVDLLLQGSAQATGEGSDTFVGIEHVTGTRTGDRLSGDGGGNWLWGGSFGPAANDIIAGRGGDDLIQVGPGANRLNGGDGADTASFFDNGVDIGGTGYVASLLRQGAGQETGHGSMLLAGFENLSGSSYGDRLSGDGSVNVLAGAAGNDVLVGGAGNDVLHGDAAVASGAALSGPIQIIAGYDGARGNDVLDGGAGADIMRGGGGNDSYVIDDRGDRVFEAGGAGLDFVRSTVSISLAANVENLLLVGRLGVAGTGNDLANVITGNAAANAIAGRGGSDRLTGGAGDDRFIFDTAPDPRRNVDFITDFSPTGDSIRLERADFPALAAGTLDAAAFRIGTAAADASDRIVYDAGSGRIFYDADGRGGAPQLLFARVDPGTALTAADFIVFGSAPAGREPGVAAAGEPPGALIGREIETVHLDIHIA